MMPTLTVNDIRLEKTCNRWPEQYYAYIGNDIIGLLHLRHGYFAVYREPSDYNDSDVVYEHNFEFPNGSYGEFNTDEEREYFLNKAKESLLNDYLKLQECQQH